VFLATCFWSIKAVKLSEMSLIALSILTIAMYADWIFVNVIRQVSFGHGFDTSIDSIGLDWVSKNGPISAVQYNCQYLFSRFNNRAYFSAFAHANTMCF